MKCSVTVKTATSHCGSTKTKRKNNVKKQKVVKGVAKIMIITRIHWKLTIGTTEIFLEKKTALTKFLDQSNKRVYAGQMELKWIIEGSLGMDHRGVFRDSIINGGATWKAEVRHNAARCGVLLGNREERRSHKVARKRGYRERTSSSLKLNLLGYELMNIIRMVTGRWVIV